MPIRIIDNSDRHTQKFKLYYSPFISYAMADDSQL